MGENTDFEYKVTVFIDLSRLGNPNLFERLLNPALNSFYNRALSLLEAGGSTKAAINSYVSNEGSLHYDVFSMIMYDARIVENMTGPQREQQALVREAAIERLMDIARDGGNPADLAFLAVIEGQGLSDFLETIFNGDYDESLLDDDSGGFFDGGYIHYISGNNHSYPDPLDMIIMKTKTSTPSSSRASISLT